MYRFLLLCLFVGAWGQNCPLLSGYSQQMVPLAGTDRYQIVFNCNTAQPVDFVDLHYRKSTGTVLSVRMTAIGGNIFQFGDLGANTLQLFPGEAISYSFTYCLRLMTCETESFSYVTVTPAPVMTPIMPSLPIVAPQLNCPVFTQYHHSVVSADGSYKIVFDTKSNLRADWIDVHYRINGGDYVNIRMASISSSMFEARNVALQITDNLEYFFTYCVNGVDCNTELHQFRLPQPIVAPVVQLSCPVFNNLIHQVLPLGEGGGYKITFDDNTPLMPDWVDLHFKINNAEYINVRMHAIGDKFEFSGVPNLNAGDILTYFFTYCVNKVDCNTDIYTFNLPQAIVAPVAPKLQCPVFIDFTHQVMSHGSGYKIVFNPNSPLTPEWVDVHYRIGQSDLINLRMNQVDGRNFEVLNIPLSLGDTLEYFFTYCIAGTDCNTEMLKYHLPLPQPIVAPMVNLVCPVLTNYIDQVTPYPGLLGKYKISFNANFHLPVEWVDVHYSINGGVLRNYRMNPLGNNLFEHQDLSEQSPLQLSRGDTLTYFFSYCISMVDCDTPPKVFTASLGR